MLNATITRARVRTGLLPASQRTPSAMSWRTWVSTCSRTAPRGVPMRETRTTPRATQTVWIMNGSAMPAAKITAPSAGPTSWLAVRKPTWMRALAIPRSGLSTSIGSRVPVEESAKTSASPTRNIAAMTSQMLTCPVRITTHSPASTTRPGAVHRHHQHPPVEAVGHRARRRGRRPATAAGRTSPRRRRAPGCGSARRPAAARRPSSGRRRGWWSTTTRPASGTRCRAAAGRPSRRRGWLGSQEQEPSPAPRRRSYGFVPRQAGSISGSRASAVRAPWRRASSWSFSACSRRTRVSSSVTRGGADGCRSRGGRRCAGRRPGGRSTPWPWNSPFGGDARDRAIYKSPTVVAGGQRAAARRGVRPGDRRGGRWQVGQKYDERFMKATRRIGVPQRSHGSPSRP